MSGVVVCLQVSIHSELEICVYGFWVQIIDNVSARFSDAFVSAEID
jgi:hypothetical protein